MLPRCGKASLLSLQQNLSDLLAERKNAHFFSKKEISKMAIEGHGQI
jgi:hypothetical protein